VAIATGIPPAALLDDSAMLYTIVDVLHERNREAQRHQ